MKMLEARPVNILALLDWIDNDEIGVIECNRDVRLAVTAWARRKADYEVTAIMPINEMNAALLSGGSGKVFEIIQRYISEVATEAVAWGAITAFQRLSDPEIYANEIVAD